MVDSDRFQDNSSGVISDNKHKKHWLPKDSWGDLGQWRNYNEAIAYVRLMNQVYAGGYSDWRLPTKAEAEGLFELDYDQIDWEEEIIHISTLFVSKCSNYIWTSDMDENKNCLLYTSPSPRD